MRILILVNDYKTITNFRLELLEFLLEQKQEVFVSVPANEKNEIFKRLGCIVCENDMTRHGTNPLAEMKQISNYRKLMKKIKPDVVLTYTIKPNMYGSVAAKRLKIPVISTVTGVGSTMQGSGIKQKLMLKLLAGTMKDNDVIFFQNEGNKELYIQHGVVGKETAILPGSGVNLEKHNYVDYPAENGKVKFIIVSRLRTDKGYDELFEAIEVLKERADVEFHIVGWYEEEKYKIKMEQMQTNNVVIFHGEKTQEEVHELIAQCHCLIHPSYHEGMSNVLMEASATGRLCLASDIPGCREIIDDGQTGYTFAVKDAGAVVEAIEKVMLLTPEQRAEYGRQARRKMEQEFDRTIVVAAYHDKIKELRKVE